MINEELLKRKSAVFQVGLLFNQQPSDEKITAYANALMNYEPKQIVYAFNQVILSGSAFFPSLAEVLTHLKPNKIEAKDVGNDVANEIIQKCIDLGRYRIDEIMSEVSDLAKNVLASNRYLIMEILDSERDQLPTIRAQIRDLVSATFKKENNNAKATKLESIGINTGRVLTFKTTDFSGYLPEGA